MKRGLLFIFFLYSTFSLFAQYSVTGGNGVPLLAENDTRNKLEVFLLNGLNGAQISFTSAESGVHQWYKYKEKALEATPIPSVQSGNTSFITDVADGYGYFVGSPTSTLTCFVWIIDYSRYVPRFFGLETTEESDKCEFLKILADVEAEAIHYFLPTGAPATLQRIYHLSYHTQEWDDNSKMYFPQTVNEPQRGVSEIVIPAPLDDTTFTLTGDTFAEYFGIGQTIRSAEYHAIAVKAYHTAETEKAHADNEVHPSGDFLGGSAPIEYTFTAYANEPVAAFYIWKIQERDSLTGNLTTLVRYTDKILRYNFEKEGTFIVSLEVIDRQSVCVDTTKENIISVIIGKTYVQIPNAFSPGSSVGVNDEFRIAYTSITSFRASIYNRWGNLLYQWTDPAKGWDGRVNGKFVPTGAYFVIVEYTDAHGKKRSASRDVNILRAKE
jgi:gliding motility-associated-like protein